MPKSLIVFILKIKQKSGIPLLPIYTFPESFNKIYPRKWLRLLMGMWSPTAYVRADR
jgi:hypothetical protein